MRMRTRVEMQILIRMRRSRMRCSLRVEPVAICRTVASHEMFGDDVPKRNTGEAAPSRPLASSKDA
eukprot:3894554-Rhodomonas_salina.1